MILPEATLPIDDLVPWRPVVQTAASRELAAKIEVDGTYDPILVRPDMVIIDGLKTYAALRRLKRTEAQVVICKNVEEAGDILAERHKGLTLPRQRFVDLLTVLRPLTRRGLRSKDAAAKRQARFPNEQFGNSYVRHIMCHALNSTQATLQSITRLVRAAEAGDKRARYYLKQYVDEGLAPSAAERLWLNKPYFNGNVDGRVEQRQLLGRVTQNLVTANRALLQLQLPIRLTAAEAEETLKALKKARQRLVSSIRRLEEEVSKSDQ